MTPFQVSVQYRTFEGTRVDILKMDNAATIRMRLDEVDKCFNRETLNEADTTELVTVRYLLHRALIRAQLRNFDKT